MDLALKEYMVMWKCGLHGHVTGTKANWRQLQLPKKQSWGIQVQKQTAAAKIPQWQKPCCGSWHRR